MDASLVLGLIGTVGSMTGIALAAHAELRASRIERRTKVDWDLRVEVDSNTLLTLRFVNIGWAEAFAPSLDPKDLLGLPLGWHKGIDETWSCPKGTSFIMNVIMPCPLSRIPDTLRVHWKDSLVSRKERTAHIRTDEWKRVVREAAELPPHVVRPEQPSS